MTRETFTDINKYQINKENLSQQNFRKILSHKYIILFRVSKIGNKFIMSPIIWRKFQQQCAATQIGKHSVFGTAPVRPECTTPHKFEKKKNKKKDLMILASLLAGVEVLSHSCVGCTTTTQTHTLPTYFSLNFTSFQSLSVQSGGYSWILLLKNFHASTEVF